MVVLAAPEATPRDYDPARLIEHLAARGVTARLKLLDVSHDAGQAILDSAQAIGAGTHIFLPSWCNHGIENTGTEMLVVLLSTAPANP